MGRRREREGFCFRADDDVFLFLFFLVVDVGVVFLFWNSCPLWKKVPSFCPPLPPLLHLPPRLHRYPNDRTTTHTTGQRATEVQLRASIPTLTLTLIPILIADPQVQVKSQSRFRRRVTSKSQHRPQPPRPKARVCVVSRARLLFLFLLIKDRDKHQRRHPDRASSRLRTLPTTMTIPRSCRPIPLLLRLLTRMLVIGLRRLRGRSVTLIRCRVRVRVRLRE